MNTKCGVVHCYNLHNFVVHCSVCESIISFEDFKDHFKEYHKPEYEEKSFVTIEIVRDPLDNKDDNEEAELKVSYSIHEITDPIEELADSIEEIFCPMEEIDDSMDERPESIVQIADSAEEQFYEEETIDIDCVDIESLDHYQLSSQKASLEEQNLEKDSQTGDIETENIATKKSIKSCKNVRGTSKKRRHYKQRSKTEKPEFYNCKHCGKTFKYKSNCFQHEKRHSVVRPHGCEFCEKEFYTNAELKNHQLCHNDERNFICDECGCRFRRSWVLQKHRRTHTKQERNLPCPYCNKLFYCKDILRNHISVHNTVPKFNCDFCKEIFTQSKALYRHKIKVHSKEIIIKKRK